MGKIALLSNEVIDKISAGEVVESPAAVVKELVENAIDAKASSIHIEIRSGGFLFIRVDDNGFGMDKEDALYCVQRHTTSKIAFADDLFHLSTMGFRGEALASIAAVSKMRILTAESGIATMVQVEGGSILCHEEAQRERGTTVEVSSLFYNTLARLSFQKSKSASTAEIIRLTIAMALSQPFVEFSLVSQGQSVIKTTCIQTADLKRAFSFRLQNVLGENFLLKSYWVDVTDGLYRVYGFLGGPGFTRSNRLGQYLFLNHRWVQSPSISLFVKDAYGTHIPETSYPHFVLHIQMPQDHLDVNVHPQKREVRLKDTSTLKKLLKEAIMQSVAKNSELSLSAPAFTPTTFSFNENAFTESNFEKKNWDQLGLYQERLSFLPPQILANFKNFLFVKGKLENGQIALGEEILLVDLARSYAKCLFEALLQNGDEKLTIHQLLVPLVVDLSQDEVVVLQESVSFLSSSGFEIRVLGEKTIALDAYPAFLPQKDVFGFLQALFYEDRTVLSERERRMALATIRFAKMRKTPFSMDEGKKIWDTLLTLKFPLLDPVGNKTVHEVRKEDLQALF